MIDVLTPGDIAFNPLGSCQVPCDSAEFVAAFYRPDAPWSGINRGGGVRFHFSKVSPYLGSLCRSDLYTAIDLPGFRSAAPFVVGDIARTC
jgi:hypothetical protein